MLRVKPLIRVQETLDARAGKKNAQEGHVNRNRDCL